MLGPIAFAQNQTAFSQWKRGPFADPSYFPIAVWLQSPSEAARYKAAGVNLYVGLYRGPNEKDLAELKSAGMQAFCSQNRYALAHLDDPTIVGWMQPDEPDNAQEVRDPATGNRSYGPPVKPEKVVADYRRIHDADPTRPVLLNLGQWVGNREWRGRGSAGRPEDYLTYVKGADIVSFDVYPVASLEKPNNADYLWEVPKGVDQLQEWTGGKKITWNALECTHVHDANHQATPHQVRAEAWMSIIHGSRGIIWFVHQFQPKFNEHALLDDPPMLAGVSAINHQIHELASVINSDAKAEVKVESSNKDVPIDAMAREHGGKTYVFAVGMRNTGARGTFSLTGMKAATVEVIGENRRLELKEGRFEDDFQPYDVHLYRINH